MGIPSLHSESSFGWVPAFPAFLPGSQGWSEVQYNQAQESIWGTKAHYEYEVLFLFQGESGIPRILGLMRSEAA